MLIDIVCWLLESASPRPQPIAAQPRAVTHALSSRSGCGAQAQHHRGREVMDSAFLPKDQNCRQRGRVVGASCASVATHALPAKAFWRGLAALVPGQWVSSRCVAAPVPVPWGGWDLEIWPFSACCRDALLSAWTLSSIGPSECCTFSYTT